LLEEAATLHEKYLPVSYVQTKQGMLLTEQLGDGVFFRGNFLCLTR
jgi:hypothetical protein